MSALSKRWVYDVVWDHSQQSLMFNVEGRFLSYNVLHLNNDFMSKKSNLIKENTTSIASRHTSKLILVSSINGCVYGIQKQINVKKKVKNAKADVIFRIEKQNSEKEKDNCMTYVVSQNRPSACMLEDSKTENCIKIDDDFGKKEDYLFSDQN